jgi:hypothetical protein
MDLGQIRVRTEALTSARRAAAWVLSGFFGNIGILSQDSGLAR